MKQFVAAISSVKVPFAFLLSVGCVAAGSVALTKPSELTSTLINPENQATASELAPELIAQILHLEKQSQFKQALNVLEPIQSASPPVALQLVMLKQRLAQSIYDRALNEYRSGNVTKAIQIAESIPSDVPSRSRYQKVQADWLRSRTIIDLAQSYFRQGQFSIALDLIDQIHDPTLKSSRLVRSLRAEIQASQPVAAVAPPESVIEPETASPESHEPQASIESEPLVEPPSETEPESASTWSVPSQSPYHSAISTPERSESIVQSRSVQFSCGRPECEFAGFN